MSLRPLPGGGINYSFSDRVQSIVAAAVRLAAERGGQVEPVHLFAGLMAQEDANARLVLEKLSVDYEVVRHEAARQLGDASGTEPPPEEMPFADRSKRLLEYALAEARELRHFFVGSEHLLLALLHVGDDPPADILGSHGVSLEDARAACAEIMEQDERHRRFEREALG